MPITTFIFGAAPFVVATCLAIGILLLLGAGLHAMWQGKQGNNPATND